MPTTPPDPTPIWHLTSVTNLESIARCGDVYCKKRLSEEGLGHRDVSNVEIQEIRAHFPVSCGPGGTLHDYVPFFFNPLSPMLFKIVRDYENPKDHRQFAHVVTTAQSIAENGSDFIFTTGHATMIQSDYYDDLTMLSEIDWNIMRGQWWNDTPDQPNRQCSRQAEFLVKDSFPIRSAEAIVVFDQEAADAVGEYFRSSNVNVPVRVDPRCFY